MSKKIYFTLTLASTLLPSLAFAQNFNGTRDLLGGIYGIVEDILIPLVFTCALLLFFWGVVKYIRSAGNEKEEGKKIMFWGIVALFVMSSVWGLVYFIGQELGNGIGDQYDMLVPTIKRQ